MIARICRVSLALAVALGAVLSSASVAVDHARADTPAPSGRIAFGSNMAGSFEIFSVNPDGSGLSQLTAAPGTDFWPSWSPDGSKIAFRSRRDSNNAEIYVINADGSNPIRLTAHPAIDDQPAWSPDGNKIAFTSTRDGNTEIYVMNVDGSGVVRLTNHPAPDLGPRWSTDGDRIVFTSPRSGHAATYVMKSDGSKVQQLTADELEAAQADWSQVGNRLTLVDELCGTCDESDVFVMKHTGTDLVQVTNTAENETVPRWSPDGQWIAFERGPFDLTQVDIWIMRSDGSGALNVTNTNTPFVFNLIPDWGPRTG